jgi:hypothetical protein
MDRSCTVRAVIISVIRFSRRACITAPCNVQTPLLSICFPVRAYLLRTLHKMFGNGAALLRVWHARAQQTRSIAFSIIAEAWTGWSFNVMRHVCSFCICGTH